MTTRLVLLTLGFALYTACQPATGVLGDPEDGTSLDAARPGTGADENSDDGDGRPDEDNDGRPDDPPPSDPDCEDACAERARAWFEQCVQDGGSEERCERAAAEWAAECVDLHCTDDCEGYDATGVPCDDDPNQPPDDSDCVNGADSAGNPCPCDPATGQDCDPPDDCTTASGEPCDPNEPPDDDCGDNTDRPCPPDGDPPDDCDAANGDCDPTDEPPPTFGECVDDCHARARHGYAECVANGRDPEVCADRALAWAQECVQTHCAPDEPPTDDCRDQCDDRAREVGRACVQAGGTRDACRERARAARRECLATQCNEAP